MIIHKGSHYNLEMQLLVQEVREAIQGQPIEVNMLHFVNARIHRELVKPFNDSFRKKIGIEPLTRCEYVSESSWTGHSIKLYVDLHRIYMERLKEEDVSLCCPF